MARGSYVSYVFYVTWIFILRLLTAVSQGVVGAPTFSTNVNYVVRMQENGIMFDGLQCQTYLPDIQQSTPEMQCTAPEAGAATQSLQWPT